MLYSCAHYGNSGRQRVKYSTALCREFSLLSCNIIPLLASLHLYLSAKYNLRFIAHPHAMLYRARYWYCNSVRHTPGLSVRVPSSTRGHPHKIFKRRTSCTLTRSEFFTERPVNVWNALPLKVVDFSSLIAFKRSIVKVYLSAFCSVT